MRRALAEALGLAREGVVARVTHALYARHPEWQQRFGERGRQRCADDARHHLRALEGALRAEAPSAFESYARWARGMLEARGIEGAHLAQHLELVRGEAAHELTEARAGLEAYGAHEGLDPHELLRPFFDSAIAACRDTGSSDDDALEPLCARYLDAALSGRRRAALDVAHAALSAGWAPIDVYERIFSRAQRELGRRWQENLISVADEHVASAITQWALAQVHERHVPSRAPLGKALLFAVEGEQHQLGLTLVADALELDGWSVVLVGAHTPIEAALRAIDEHRPSVVGLGVTMLANLPATLDAVAAARERWPSLTIVVGGRGLVDAGAASVAAGALGPCHSLEAARVLMAGLAARA